MASIFKRYIVTAHSDNGPFRYVAETQEDANSQADIFSAMGLYNVTVRGVLMDIETGNIV